MTIIEKMNESLTSILESSSDSEDAKVIYNDKGWKIIKISKWEDAVKYGEGTKWDFAEGTDYRGGDFDGKSSFNILKEYRVKDFYFFIKDDGDKWCYFDLKNREDTLPLLSGKNTIFEDKDGFSYSRYKLLRQVCESIPIDVMKQVPSLKEIIEEEEEKNDKEVMEAIEYSNEPVNSEPSKNEPSTEVMKKVSNPDDKIYVYYLLRNKDSMTDDELETFKEALERVRDCCDAIKNAISIHYNGSSLSKDVASKVIEKYGKNLVKFVLATYIKNKNDEDIRISDNNRLWASTIKTSNDIDVIDRVNIPNHPGLVNMFIDEVKGGPSITENLLRENSFSSDDTVAGRPLSKWEAQEILDYCQRHKGAYDIDVASIKNGILKVYFKKHSIYDEIADPIKDTLAFTRDFIDSKYPGVYYDRSLTKDTKDNTRSYLTFIIGDPLRHSMTEEKRAITREEAKEIMSYCEGLGKERYGVHTVDLDIEERKLSLIIEDTTLKTSNENSNYLIEDFIQREYPGVYYKKEVIEDTPIVTLLLDESKIQKQESLRNPLFEKIKKT